MSLCPCISGTRHVGHIPKYQIRRNEAVEAEYKRRLAQQQQHAYTPVRTPPRRRRRSRTLSQLSRTRNNPHRGSQLPTCRHTMKNAFLPRPYDPSEARLPVGVSLGSAVLASAPVHEPSHGQRVLLRLELQGHLFPSTRPGPTHRASRGLRAFYGHSGMGSRLSNNPNSRC